MHDLVIIGAGGFAREVAWLVEEINQSEKTWNFLGFIDEDDTKKGSELNGYPVIGDFSKLKQKSNIYAIVGVGSPRVKKKLVGKCFEQGLRFANLIHPGVRHSNYLKLGLGTIICAGNILTVNIEIGNHVILNLDCTVGHDVVIKDFCTVAPAVNISGNVVIGEGCDLGTNCSIIQGKTIGEWSTIGAGAVVIDDIPVYSTAVGVPAKTL